MTMDNSQMMARIVSVEWAQLYGRRPRHAGSNARLGSHGIDVTIPLALVTTDDGASGFGYCQAEYTQAQQLLGARLDDVFTRGEGPQGVGTRFEYPLWDLVGQRLGWPVYKLAADPTHSVDEPFAVPCYDTSLYFDDLHLDSHAEAAELIAAEARAGYERGHRSFKIKVGRGARHLPLEAGTERDIAVVRAVRAAVGSECIVMLDANNGYNLNLAKRVIERTADCGVHWLEEPFHEDRVLYDDLKQWLARVGLPVLIADGEGQAAPTLLDWAHEGLIDVVQYDIFGYGFTAWLKLGKQLDSRQVQSAPHHYGRYLGNYVAGHLASALRGFAFVEWDEAVVPEIDASSYTINRGMVQIPNTPGFGLHLDEMRFRRVAQESGYVARS